MAAPLLFVLTRLIAALPSPVDPDMAAERCPDYCASFKCDGSAWCLNGAMPAPCTGCPSFAQAAAFAVSPPRREITIPPYVGATSGSEAEAQCEKLGGHLASAANEAENKHLLSILVKYKRDRAIIGAQRTWLGGDEWRWQGTEQPLSYWNWAPNQPDNTFDQCSEMWTTGEWNDIKCEVWPSMAYLCDVAVPEPGFTFICSPGVQARLPCQGFGCHAKASTTKLCRYVIKTMSLEGQGLRVTVTVTVTVRVRARARLRMGARLRSSAPHLGSAHHISLLRGLRSHATDARSCYMPLVAMLSLCTCDVTMLC